MSLSYSVDLRNAGLDARIAAIGPNATLRICSADTDLVSIRLGKDWMAPAKNGVLSNSRSWSGHAKAEGKAKTFCICNSEGWPCISGNIPEDMKLDNVNLAPGQEVTVSSFTIRSGNG
jgi:hypothetical protein